MNFILRSLCVLLKCITVLLTPYFWLLSKRTRKSVPTISDALLKISATDLAEKIRKREVSSEQVCIAYIKRIKEVNPILNAVVEDRFESALNDARNVDIYLRTALCSSEELEKSKPLLGVPLTVKESCSLAEAAKVRASSKSEEGWSLRRIARDLNVSRSCISKIIKKWRLQHTVARARIPGRPKISTNVEDAALVDHIDQEPFSSAVKARQETNFPGSVRTARKRIKGAGLANRAAARKPFLTEAHKENRVGFALQYLNEGLSLCGGTLSRAGMKSPQDGDVVQKLKSSGAIPLLVSNTPEICLSWESYNFITGRTNNPYDTSRTSSGSSGGEGALLGAGASVIGIGSDVAGSIRLPAMFNGVFGHKPSARVIPIRGHYPWCEDEKYWDYFAIGPMTRYSKDLKLMMRVMAEESIVSELRLEEKVDLSKIRVLFMEDEGKSFTLMPVQEEITEAVKQSVQHLKSKCNSIVVDNIKFKELKNSCEIAGSALYTIEDIPNLLKPNNQNLFVELLKSIVGLSNFTFNLLLFYSFQYLYQTFVANEGYLQKNEYLKQLFKETLSHDGVFLYPTFTSSAIRHGTFMLASPGVSYLMIFNSLGLPSTHVPCGLDKNGLPIGIQVVAAPKQDRLCFAVAEELEKCWAGWIPPT